MLALSYPRFERQCAVCVFFKACVMEWIKLQLKVLRSEEYIGCDPVQRAAYINLLGYCVDQENWGVIKGCRSWSDRKWMRLCGVMKSEVVECGLFRFNGDDLEIYAYPVAEQKACESKREKGRAAALKRWHDGPPSGSCNGSPKAKPNGSPNAEKSRVEKSREEERRRDTHAHDDTDPFKEPSEKQTLNDDQLWRMERLEQWATELRAIGAKMGQENWRYWQRLHDEYGPERLHKAVAATNSDKRWPDTVEKKLAAKRLGSGSGLKTTATGRLIIG